MRHKIVSLELVDVNYCLCHKTLSTWEGLYKFIKPVLCCAGNVDCYIDSGNYCVLSKGLCRQYYISVCIQFSLNSFGNLLYVCDSTFTTCNGFMCGIKLLKNMRASFSIIFSYRLLWQCCISVFVFYATGIIAWGKFWQY